MKISTKTLLTLALGAVTLLSACIPSVHPFYSSQDRLFDKRLLGEWEKKDAGGDLETWLFERGSDQACKLTVTDKDGKTGVFTAQLFKINESLFLDIIPEEVKLNSGQAELVGMALIPGHLLIHVSQLGPELKLAFFDFDWLSKHLEANPAALLHHREDKRMVLTASTDDLRRFVVRHLESGLFGDVSVFAKLAN